MDGLSRITDRIAMDTQQESSDILTHAREDAHMKQLHFQKAAKEKRSSLLAHAHAQAQDQVKRTTAAAELDARKTLLSVKQQLVSQVFESALRELASLPPEEYRAFLVRLAVKSSLTGTEEIILNEGDLKTHGSTLVAEANRSLSNAGRTAALTLSQETRRISGGLILRSGPVESNCTLEVLIKLSRNTLTGEVAKVLFDS